jgi:hypothetical protein
VVNNAGVFISKPFTEHTDADYDAVTGVKSARVLRGVTCRCVRDAQRRERRPRDIRTPMHDPATYDALAERHPLGRVGDIDDVVEAVLYLENSPFVTGEIMHVDGGQSAGH